MNLNFSTTKLQIALSFGYFLLIFLPSLLNSSYGVFVDEFYYLECSNRLDYGYVDHPPFSVFFLSLFSLFKSNIFVLRFIPPFLGAASVFLIGSLVKKLGGNKIGILLASIGFMSAPVFQVLFGFYSMNSFETLFILILFLLLVELKNSQNDRIWIFIGMIVGILFMNKHTSILYSVSLLVPVFAMNFKRNVRSIWFWVGLVFSIVIVFPNLYWQWKNHFVSIEFYKLATIYKNIHTVFYKSLLNQILSQNPATFPLWLAGFYALWKNSVQRHFFYSLLFLFLLFIFSGSSRPDRIASIYPILFAFGSLALYEKWKKILLSIIFLFGLVLLPITVPILPPEKLAVYSKFLGVVPEIEKGKQSPLPQWFADRIGWEEFAKNMFFIIEKLSGYDKENLAIYTNYYGEAGALKYFGAKNSIISGHNQYYLWGAPEKIESLIVFGEENRKRFLEYYSQSEKIGDIPDRRNTSSKEPVFILRKPKIPLKKVWTEFKNFI